MNWGPRPIQSIDARIMHPRFGKSMKDEWRSMGFTEKLKNLKTLLKRWNWELFGVIDHKIKKLEEEVAIVNSQLQPVEQKEVVWLE